MILHRSPRLCKRECDFYRSPTLLSRLILLRHYSAAIRRVCSPDGNRESFVWCCAKREGSDQYHIRQLPIHMAARCLSNSPSNPELLRLIAQLVVANPDGCEHSDHQGRYPLHEVVWYGASLEVISALLIAAPDIVHQADRYSRYPYELNERRPTSATADETYRSKVRGLLQKPRDHWEIARQEYRFRMKQRFVPDDDVSIQSTTPLASDTIFASIDDESTVATLQSAQTTDDFHQHVRESLQKEKQYWAQAKEHFHDRSSHNNATVDSKDTNLVSSLTGGGGRQAKGGNDNHKTSVQPLEGTQMEQRTLALEEQLARALEQNYQQAAIIAELRTGGKNEINEVSVLQDEIRRLQQTISLLETRPNEEKSEFLASLEWMNDWRKENNDLKEENNKLQGENQDYELRIAYYEKVLDGLSFDSMSSIAPSNYNKTSLDDSSLRTELDEDDNLVSPMASSHGVKNRLLATEVMHSWSFEDTIPDLPAILEHGPHQEDEDLSENFTELLHETARKYGVW